MTEVIAGESWQSLAGTDLADTAFQAGDDGPVEWRWSTSTPLATDVGFIVRPRDPVALVSVLRVGAQHLWVRAHGGGSRRVRYWTGAAAHYAVSNLLVGAGQVLAVGVGARLRL